MEKMIYLDNAATTKTRPEVVEAMLPYFTESYGNPSSVYTFSAKSKEAVTKAREIIADSLGVKSNEIYFTAGGSEADNWAWWLRQRLMKPRGSTLSQVKLNIMPSFIPCEYLEKRGYEVTYLDVDENGVVKLDELKKAIRPDTILISIMFANNEIGTIERLRRSEPLQRSTVSCFIPMRYRHTAMCPFQRTSTTSTCSAPAATR